MDDLLAGLEPRPRHQHPLVDFAAIYLTEEAARHPRGREVLARYPDVPRTTVASHWNIPELHGAEGLEADWVRTKRGVLVLGVRKTMTFRPNGRSADFIAPGLSNGCAMACAYCYVARRKGHANPITLFVNDDAIMRAIARHAARQGRKPAPDQVDPAAWVYDVGENGDASADAMVTDGVRDLVAAFRALPNAKASFATKFVNGDLLGFDPQGRTRARFSLLPEEPARVLDVRTSPVAERIAAVSDFVAAGYEVHLNISPVVVFEGWEAAYARLFEQVDDALSPAAKAQLAAEVIMLTHNAELHETNLRWHPKAEALLWRPDLQEAKRSESGQTNLRYRSGEKRRLLGRLLALLRARLPYCQVRYAF